MALKWTELQASKKMYLLIGVGFQLGSADITLHELLLIKFRDKGNELKAA